MWVASASRCDLRGIGDEELENVVGKRIYLSYVVEPAQRNGGQRPVIAAEFRREPWQAG
jgi:hypothetical protein